MSSEEITVKKPARAAEVSRATSNGQSGSSRHLQAARSEAIEVRSLDDPELYVNRELSLLAFQSRVLEEAQDVRNPLLERVKFLSILGSNLDEFFMVRVAGLKRQIEKGVHESGPDGMKPDEQLEAIREKVSDLLKNAQDCLRGELLPALKKTGIYVVDYLQLTGALKDNADHYFSETVFPILTPLAVDPGRPFPLISNLSLNLAVIVRDTAGNEHFARIKVPDSLPQLVLVTRQPKKVPAAGKPVKQQHFIWLEQLIVANLAMLFPGMEIVEAHPFHVVRDADSSIQELEAGDLLESIEEGVWQRRFADVVRLEINDTMSAKVLDVLLEHLEIDRNDVYSRKGPLALTRLKYLAGLDRPELKEKPFVPVIPARLDPEQDGEDIFAAIRRQDVLLHHPFDSFQPVINFLQQAARDPKVLAIKITLYRVGPNSPVVEALLQAVENGKQVAALVELKARFDEESNIEWARALEREGVHVVYGLLGLKVHCKTALVVRQEGEVIRRYVHLATGNYNALTSQLYTDIGMFTCDETIAADCTDLFNRLTGYSAKAEYRKLLVAPVNLRARIEHLIRREIAHQQRGERGRLIFKMNALVDARIIRLLYEASQAGVQIDLLVRGICCLRPGITGVSETIRVTSIVGRFLEHSRVYYFGNAGREEIYLGSADMMPRNLDHRVEVLFPVQDSKLIRYLRDQLLVVYLEDSVKARHMQADGSYTRSYELAASNGNRAADPAEGGLATGEKMNSQEWFLKHAAQADA